MSNSSATRAVPSFENSCAKPVYAWYVVSVLTTAYIFSFIDRQILNLLVVPIQNDLGLSDTQIGLLQGIAFALFYTLMGIPLGRLADRSSRRAIIGFGIFAWSLMTMGCGFARSFFTLFLARVGVGIGEATLSPSAYSLISDYFPADKVTRAIAVYAGGSFVGGGLAYIVGGAVLDYIGSVDLIRLGMLETLKPWQAAFIIVGLPGILLALLLVTVREPARRSGLPINESISPSGVTIRETILFLRRYKRVYLCHYFGYSIFAIVAYAVMAWMPTYLIRNFKYSPGEVGLTYGLIVLVFGTVGVVGAGWLADRVRVIGFKDANMRIIMFAALALTPLVIMQSLVAHETTALIFISLATLLWSMPHGVAPAALIAITPNQLRGQISALYLFTLNMTGLSLGPLSVGLLTDYYFKDPLKVGQSLALVCGTACLIAALILWYGLAAYRKAIEQAEKGWPA